MHIALVTHKLVRGDGQGRVNMEIAQAALRRGWRVTLIAGVVAPELLAHANVRWIRIETRGWPTELVRNQVFAVKSALAVRRLRRELNVLHANGFVAWTGADINTCHFVHAAWVRSPFHTWQLRRDIYGAYQRVYSLTGTLLERWSYRRARFVIAVSQQVKRELAEAGVDRERIRVIPNGVDIEEFRPGTPSRGDLGLPEGKLVLFVGDIKTSRKNLDTVLRAMVGVPDATLLVAGEESGSAYPLLAARLGIQSRIRFLGFRRDVPRLMQAADVFVFPSRYEPSGLVLLEAAASGLPIIAAKTVGGTEILGEEGCVLLNDPEDAVELASALRRVLAAPAELQRLRDTARRIAVANSWQTMAQRYLQLYGELLADGKEGGVSRDRSTDGLEREMRR